MTQFSTRLSVNWQLLCSSPLVLFIRRSPARGLLHQTCSRVHKLRYGGGGACCLRDALLGGRLRTPAGLFSYLTRLWNTSGDLFALIYQCEWVAHLTELLECCRHADSMKCKSPEKLQHDRCMSMCTNCCLSSTSQEDRKCFEAISITGGMQN